MPGSHLDREVIRDRALAQPQVDSGELVSEASALAFFEDLKQNNPVLHSHIKGIIDSVDRSLAHSLSNEIAPLVRRGIVARAAIAGAAQIVSDTGQSFLSIDAFKQSLGITSEIIPTTEE